MKYHDSGSEQSDQLYKVIYLLICHAFIMNRIFYDISEIVICFIRCIYLVKVEATLANLSSG